MYSLEVKNIVIKHYILLMLLFYANTNLAQDTSSLKDIFKGKFLIGAAINFDQSVNKDLIAASIVIREFNSVTPENAMKWEHIHPVEGTYTFEPADKFVSFGKDRNMFIVGHTLVWHSQTPKWVFESEPGKPASREQLIERMHDHISTIVGRYKGVVKGWDVVNEALNEDGSFRESPWFKIIGEDYIELAFKFAHEADPEAKLYYNDFSIENKPKRDGTVRLFKMLKEKGVTIDGIGIQEHVKMNWPSAEQLDSTINDFHSAGADVMITELDVDVLPAADKSNTADVNLKLEMQKELDPYTSGLPDSVQNALANRYAELFNVYIRNSDKISRVTLWGVTDKDSWLNNWPVRGRTSYPLLFSRSGEPKKAYYSIINAAEKK
mgnify:CR=1 FL=1